MLSGFELYPTWVPLLNDIICLEAFGISLSNSCKEGKNLAGEKERRLFLKITLFENSLPDCSIDSGRLKKEPLSDGTSPYRALYGVFRGATYTFSVHQCRNQSEVEDRCK